MLDVKILDQLQWSNSDYAKTHSNLLGCIMQKLEKNEHTICDLVESLQSLLTDVTPSKRALGTQFLVDVINSLSKIISAEQLKFLAAFFVDRLKDHYTVMPHVILGMLALIRKENIHDEDVKVLMQGIFRESHCQSLPMVERRNIYLFLKFCVLNKYQVVKTMNTEFILGFISIMEGEKDPRNLAILFSFIPQVAQLCPENFAEDFFELIAAYFPIDFMPPANNPFGVVPEDLVLGLRRCLASSDSFATFCLPLLKEKLDSDVISAKLDALYTLQACLVSYSPLSVHPNSLLLWESLRREMLQGRNMEVQIQAEECLKSLVKTLEIGSVTSPIVKEILVQLGDEAMVECIPHLRFPEQRLMTPSSKVLLAISFHSKYLSEIICAKVLPLLLDEYRSKTMPLARQNILICLSKFLNEYSKWKHNKDKYLELQANSVEVFIESLESSYSTVIETAVSCLGLIASVITNSQTNLACQHLLQILTQSPGLRPSSDNCDLRAMTVCTLRCLEKHSPNILLEVVIPKLLQILDADDKQVDVLVSILSSVSDLCVNEASMRLILPHLWNKVFALVRDSQKEQCVQYLNCVHKIVDGAYDLAETSCVDYMCGEWNGLLRCYQLALKIAKSNIEDSVPILQQISAISQCLIYRQDLELIACLVDVMLDVQGVGSLQRFCDPMLATQLEEEAKTCVTNPAFKVYCMEGVTLSDPNSLSKFSNCSAILNSLKIFGLTATDTRVSEVASRLHAAHILKIESESQLSIYLESLQEEFLDHSFNDENFELMKSSVLFLGWIVKGLIMRGYVKDIPWIEKLESLLLNPKLGQTASDCYTFLLKDTPELFSQRNIPKTFRMLYKQRFFERRIDALVNQFNEMEGRSRIPTLMALSHIMTDVSQGVLKGHLKKLIPVLYQGLIFEDGAVTCAAVNTLSSLLRDNLDAVISFASRLITPLLELAVSSSLNNRVKSIECLESLAFLPFPTVSPLKQEVLQKLKTPLGDRKRVVRHAATNARCAWVLL